MKHSIKITSLFILFIIFCSNNCVSQTNKKEKTNKIKYKIMEYNKLTPEEERVIIHKDTEHPFTGEYLNNKQEGTYVCRRCNTPLYRSEDKFDSRCGWPSFDDEIKGATEKQPRHCVNSISMKFIPKADKNLRTVYFSSGCFWGTEYYFMKAKGVKHTTVGFMGGHVENPSYEEVCRQNTGHLETTEVTFDTTKTSYEDLVKLFFETHDFTQTNGQGPDIGSQYLSCIFYSTPEEEAIARKYIDILTSKGYKVATMLKPATKFWRAENYHQQYYEHKGSKPYCHKYTKIF